MEYLHFLHVPRTGGTARRVALKGDPRCKFSDHDTPVSLVRDVDTPVIFVRDPVERFVSSWDLLRRNVGHLIGHLNSVEELAYALPATAEMFEEARIPILRPQVWWFDADRPSEILPYGTSEEMEQRLERLVGHPVTLSVLNESRDKPALNARAADAVRDFYTDDIAMLQSLEGIFI
jgi:hypothetical protein